VEPAVWSGAADALVVRDEVVSRSGLFQQLTQAQRVVQLSALPGSGKTVLLRSWIAESGLAGCAAWVSVPGEERDPQRLWLSVLGALSDTAAGAALVRGLTAAPDLDGWTVVERLLEDLAPLQERTIAEYLLAEVLERQSEEARLLLRTSILRHKYSHAISTVLIIVICLWMRCGGCESPA
jgi:LuxR family transcriptional regulator, maltose regulon positive regulatory protein